MHALAIIRYRRPLEEAKSAREAHRDYLRQLKRQGLLIASGPFDPHVGGALLLRVTDAGANDALDRIREEDPFTKQKLAQYELLIWNVQTGVEDLDSIR